MFIEGLNGAAGVIYSMVVTSSSYVISELCGFIVALDLPTSVDLATNKLMTTTLSAIAEFENNRPKELQKKGIQAAQRKGKYQGPKTVINKTLIQKVKHLKETKNLSVSEIRKLSYHLQSLKRAFRLRIKSIN